MSKEAKKLPEKAAKKSKTHRVEFLHWQVTRVLEQVLEAELIPYQISVSEWRLLGLIKDQGELQATEIALSMGVKLPLVTRQVGSLKRKKWITVLPHAKDRRIKRIFISPLGKEKLELIEKIMTKAFRKSFHNVSKEELEVYGGVLAKIIYNGKS